MLKRALFLDRDGVINLNHGYVSRKEDFDFIDGIFELVASANRAGYLVVIVTNQAGIGRGYYTEEDFHRLMDWVGGQFRAHGGTIDAVYFCPDHPEHGIGKYLRESACRKPAPGMLLQAASDHGIDLGASIMVGDKASDIEAGLAAGVGTLLYYGRDDEAGNAICVGALKDVSAYFK
ncbi:MAG TPA: HAD family hydrolase [Gammaproteobacteria bacterium]|nr:HAD family hydrolase [Gammaproteobacteria bacterium]